MKTATKYTEQEVQFAISVLDSGPDCVEVAQAPTDRVRAWLVANWGTQCDRGFADVFKVGYERTRHAADDLLVMGALEEFGLSEEEFEGALYRHCHGQGY